MSINRTLLAAFHAVASAGSFTAAARERNVSQSTLSAQVGRLERTYGCRLFFRRGRMIELTDMGRSLFDVTRRQFEAEAEAEELLSGREGGLLGHLRFGVVSSVLLIDHLKSFLETHEHITISLELSNSQRIIRDVADGNIDVGIIAFPIADPRIEKIALLREDLLVLVGPEHEWAGNDEVAFSALADQALILRERGSRTRQLVEDNLAQHGIGVRKMTEINEWSAMRDLVRANMGVAVVPESEGRSFPAQCKVRIRELQMQMTQFVIFRSDRKALSTLSAFLDIVEARDR